MPAFFEFEEVCPRKWTTGSIGHLSGDGGAAMAFFNASWCGFVRHGQSSLLQCTTLSFGCARLFNILDHTFVRAT
jgi:hypothetical protein